MTDKKRDLPPRVYVHGAIGKGREIWDLFDEYGADNPNYYKFGDPYAIYYINKDNRIAYATPENDIYHVIKNSDWVELKPKQSKKVRTFMFTVKEGASTCNGCEFSGKCTDEQRNKCDAGKQLQLLLDLPEMAWKTLKFEDVTDRSPFPTSYND